MKTDYSKQGLSEIIEESDREEGDYPKRQLAKLSNLQFLSQYVHLNPMMPLRKHDREDLKVPLNKAYSRFVFDEEKEMKRMKNELQEQMTNVERAQLAVLSKQQLKALAAKKLEESQSKQKLSTSRKEKRDFYYQLLKTSRRFNSEKIDKSGSNFHSVEQIESFMKVSMQQPSIKDASTSQSPEDLFLIIIKAGEQRDNIKKQWYYWGQKASRLQQQTLLKRWIQNHENMKEILQQLMEKLTLEIGSSEIFKHFRRQNSSFLSKKGIGSKSKKTLTSTEVFQGITAEQSKQIARFSQWFNKLLLDERELKLINSQFQMVRKV